MWNLLAFLSTALNFTYTLEQPPDGKWGIGDPKVKKIDNLKKNICK